MFRRRKQKMCPHLFLFGCPYCSSGTETGKGTPAPLQESAVKEAGKPLTGRENVLVAESANGSGAGTARPAILTEKQKNGTSNAQFPLLLPDAGISPKKEQQISKAQEKSPEIPVSALPKGLTEVSQPQRASALIINQALHSQAAEVSESEAAIDVFLFDTAVVPSHEKHLTSADVASRPVPQQATANEVVPSTDNFSATGFGPYGIGSASSQTRSGSSNMTSETSFPALPVMAAQKGARKRTSLFSLSRLRTFVSDSLAIDMGSTSTIIAVHGRGIVVDEPSVVALNKLTGEPIAFGYEAHQMQGREAREITVVSPLVDGVVADWEVTQAMLDHFVRSARSGFSHFSRRAVMSIVSGITQVEQRALLTAVERARINRTYLVEEGLAAALGGGVAPDDERGSAVVDIGGSTTNVAAIAQGKIVHAHAERIGGNDVNSAIVEHMRRHHGLGIGLQSAENLKIELGSATVPEDLSRTKLVKGRDIQTGSPGASEVTAGEIYAVAHPILHQIAKTVNQALTELPSEVAADIYDRGLVLTGGGALLTGFVDYLKTETRLPVRLADEPRFAIVRGLAHMFEEPALLHRMVRQEELELLEAEAQAFEG